MKVQELERLAQVRALLVSGEAKRRRVAAGLSLSEVATTCGVDTSTLWRWEQGLRVPRGASALAYQRVLVLLSGPGERAS